MNAPSQFALTAPDGTELQGEEEGSGRPLVVAHGLTATRRYVLQGSRLLARRGHARVVAYDARGHGESGAAPGRRYDYPALTADLAAVLADRGIECAVVAGSSMGAATAMALALAEPARVEALVQITPAYDGAPRTGALAGWDARAEALDAGDVDRFVALTGAGGLPERFRETARLAVRQRIERHRDLSAVAEALRQVPRSAAFPGLERLTEVEVPVLVVGSRDAADPDHPLAVAEEYVRLLPRARLVVEDEGEVPLAWQGARLSRAIQAFLEQELSGA